MSRMPDMTPTSLETAVALRTGKIIKNVRVFERGEKNRRKTDFSERGLALKGLHFFMFLI